MSTNIIPFKPNRQPELQPAPHTIPDYETMAEDGDLRAQFVIFARRMIAAADALAQAQTCLEEARNKFLPIAERCCPEK
jgi:hypothetical protein